MIGYFPEGEQVIELLKTSRDDGLEFDTAWSAALMHVQRGRPDTSPRWRDARLGLEFAREAFERAYYRQPPVRQDVIALALLHVMELMLDDSEDAQATPIAELMEAA